jgi:hypothetical protein
VLLLLLMMMMMRGMLAQQMGTGQRKCKGLRGQV